MERQPRRRRRPALSCLECRRRKIKCDRNDPCAHCVSAKTYCTYKSCDPGPIVQQQLQRHISQRPTQDLSDSVATSPAQAPRISVTRPPTENVHLPSRTQAATAEQENTTDSNSPSLNCPQDGEPQLWSLLQRGQKPEETPASSPIHGLTETGRHILAQRTGLRDSQIILNKTRILGWSHWMGTAPEVQCASSRAMRLSANHPASMQPL